MPEKVHAEFATVRLVAVRVSKAPFPATVNSSKSVKVLLFDGVVHPELTVRTAPKYVPSTAATSVSDPDTMKFCLLCCHVTRVRLP